MKITCQSCQSKYNVADEKVQGKIVKIRCRKCGATIVVQANGETVSNGAASASRGPTPPPPLAGADAQWHVNLGEGEPRAMTVREIVDSYNSGVVTQDTLLWAEGMDDWKPLSEVDAVVAALHASAEADASAANGHDEPPPPAPAPEPAFPSHRTADSAPPGDDAPTAIGSFAMLAQQQPEAQPEPKRAAVKREPRNRDLFASRVATEEMQTSAPAVAQIASSRRGLAAIEEAGPKLTGERNENSVLFSLAVLTKDAERASGEAKAASTGAASEDSGLIDLKALAAKAESIRPAAVIADGAVFAPPLGAIAPLGAPLGAVGMGSGDDRPRSMLPLIIGGGAGALVLGVLCVFVGMKLAGSGNAAAAVAASAVASAARAPVAPTIEPSATASAAPPAASAEEKPASAPKPRAVYHAPAKHEAAPASHETGASAPAAPKAAPKKTSDCGCNGDLMCLMKCSTH